MSDAVAPGEDVIEAVSPTSSERSVALGTTEVSATDVSFEGRRALAVELVSIGEDEVLFAE